MRELTYTVQTEKSLITLVESDPTRGGLSRKEVKEQLNDAEENSYAKWFKDSPTKPPGATSLYKALYDERTDGDVIEWNRLHPFQEVAVRMIAVRTFLQSMSLTPRGQQPWEEREGNKLMVEAEIVNQTLNPLPKLSLGQKFHIYCSEHNPPFAHKLIDKELRGMLDERVTHMPVRKRQRSKGSALGNSNKKLYDGELVNDGKLVMGQVQERDSHHSLRPSPLIRAASQSFPWNWDSESQTNGYPYKHMLLYLTSATWTRGEKSKALGEELKHAMKDGVHILMVHEMIGGDEEDNQERHACEFSQFFSCKDGATPEELLRLGIYREIAQPLKGPGDFRKASLMQLAQGLTVAIKASTTTSRTLLKAQAEGGPAALKTRRRWSWWRRHKQVAMEPEQRAMESETQAQSVDKPTMESNSGQRSDSCIQDPPSQNTAVGTLGAQGEGGRMRLAPILPDATRAPVLPPRRESQPPVLPSIRAAPARVEL